MKAKRAKSLGLKRETAIGPDGAIVKRYVTDWKPIKMVYCGRDQPHRPHGKCGGLRAHPGVMIGRTS